MNIARSFAQFMENEGYGTFGTSLFVGNAPLDRTDEVYWIVPTGGNSIISNQTGEKMKSYIINVFYRNSVAEEVYETLQEFEEAINSDACTQLQGFDTIDVEATQFAADQDIDDQERTVGLVQVTIQTYL